MMKRTLPLAFSLVTAAQTVSAQVRLDVPLVLTGPEQERAVVNLAEPASGTAAITVGGSVRAAWAWGEPTIQDTVIALQLSPPATSYAEGMLVRFRVPGPLAGQLHIAVDGLPPLPLVRPDGLPVALGQLEAGTVAEVIQAEGRFTLLSAAERSCPSGFVQVNPSYCIESSPGSAQGTWLWAIGQCASRGGRLCTWGEYASACMLLGNQLSGMFSSWEWIDDTSNHTHGADQAGRTTCMSQRTTLVSQPGRARCCYHLR
ncbi:MAG: hypothetical protein QY325_03145 [Flavobacteriales bacterium]|nr:MAG: hypothetical protein QY325_03145 [Flavobacteriales bacterium]